MAEQRFNSFEEFWPFYLGEHSLAVTRWLHFAGSSLALLQLFSFLATGRFAALPVVLVTGYGFAWVGHFFFEKNRPATFKYPLWSFIGDWKMWSLMLTGRLNAELQKHGIAPRVAAQ